MLFLISKLSFERCSMPLIISSNKSKAVKGLEDCGVKGELRQFKPTKSGKNTYYIPISVDSARIISQEVSTQLVDSVIFKTSCMIL